MLKRVRDSRRLREIKETGEISGDALWRRKESEKQLETDRDQGD